MATKRKSLTKKEAMQYARIFGASALLNIEPSWFEVLTPKEAGLISDAFRQLAEVLNPGKKLNSATEIMQHILSLRE
ncbi:hypothetical protein [Hymenobacter sp. YC55]|uniref:hypothetical protein n=1 Tax=Hymenobacter sp. YC55 TaxID=3034019 RepID=UPI0023F789ED|nr:hypothetical protein [Hymenobacter sp. YC55]MDF7809940.1 hypothetical protein [Hymenobacter sp. YC55]